MVELFYALVLASVLCLIESRNCSKRAKMWDAIADLEERIEELRETTRKE